MTTLFDKTTEKLAIEKYIDYRTKPNCVPAQREGFTAGRNSARESLEIACRALEEVHGPLPLDENPKLTIKEALEIFCKRMMIAKEAIAEIKARGDWCLPMEEK